MAATESSTNDDLLMAHIYTRGTLTDSLTASYHSAIATLGSPYEDEHHKLCTMRLLGLPAPGQTLVLLLLGWLP